MFSSVRTSSGGPTAWILPGLASMMTWWAYFAVMFRSWQIVMITMPFSMAMALSISITYTWYLTSRFAVGSSRMRTAGSCTNPLAIDTFWC